MGEGGHVTRRVGDKSVDGRRAGELMRRAMAIATATWPHPNPRVGAVVVDAEGAPVAEAAHEGPGRHHAEAAAFAAAGERARGGTLVVTLEPCDHQGRTPPCTEAIIAAGIATVVVGAVDPDPRVAGAGIRRLRAAGIDVEVGVPDLDAESIDPAYFHHRRTGLPFVTVKMAGTLDGQAAAADGTSRWITSPAAREDVHRLRAEADAVMVGAGTLRDDDPALTVRLPGYRGPQPIPVVAAGRRPLPENATIFERNALIVTTGEHDEVPPSVDRLTVPGSEEGVDLKAMLAALGRRGVVSMLVEGGPRLAGSFVRQGLADRIVVYIGARIAGGVGRPVLAGAFPTLQTARPVEIVAARRIGDDVRIDAVLKGNR